MPSGCDRNGNGLVLASVAASDTDDMYDDGSGGPNDVGGVSSSPLGGLVAKGRGRPARAAKFSQARAWYGVDRTQVRSIVESVVLEIGPFSLPMNPCAMPMTIQTDSTQKG